MIDIKIKSLNYDYEQSYFAVLISPYIVITARHVISSQ